MKKYFYLIVFILSAQFLDAQSTVDKQVLAIRNEFQLINSHLNNYIKKEVFYTVKDRYWNNVHYTGYLNSGNELVKLTYSIGEEGYWGNYEYYFKNGEVFFIFIHSGEPDGSEKQERIYIWNKTIINALLKEKTAEDKRNISEIENKRDDIIMENVINETKNNLNGVDIELTKFYSALNN